MPNSTSLISPMGTFKDSHDIGQEFHHFSQHVVDLDIAVRTRAMRMKATRARP